MKLPKIFNVFLKKQSKKEKKEKELKLIEDFNKGRILHINDNVDNKEIFSKK